MTTAMKTKRLQGAANARSSSKSLLPALLDMPNLARRVAALEPRTLARLVERIGLEDAGEIVALASTAQLVALLDEDLWSNERPGDEESFDAARFLTWLSVLQEAGEAFAAERVAELSLDFVTLAFSKLMLVLNVDVMVEEFDGGGEEVDRIEKALSNCSYEEMDEFQLIARRAEGWDALGSLLLALDRDHRAFLRQVLERCCDLSHAYVEDNGGLYDVLSDEQMLESDARAEREERRAAWGHVAPSDAKSFLGLAAAETDAPERDAVTRAYFRELSPRAGAQGGTEGRAHRGAQRGAARIERMLLTLEAEESGRATKRLPAANGVPALALTRALAELKGAAAAARREELAYLANVLIAAASVENRRFRPVEALEAAIGVCNLGLGLGLESERDAAAVLESTSLDVLFRRGYSLLHRELVAPARALRTEPTLAEDVPRLPDAAGLGFVSTREELARARQLLAAKAGAATGKRGQRSARVNGSSQ